jgi:NADPH2:quinone reductase
VAGTTIYGTADDAKLDQVRRLEADVTIAYKTTDFVHAVKEGSNGRGVDVILDFIGAANFERNFTCLATGARTVASNRLSSPTR